MKEIVEATRKAAQELLENLDKGFDAEGNILVKAAVKRARKNSSELTNLGVKFRKGSVAAEKGV